MRQHHVLKIAGGARGVKLKKTLRIGHDGTPSFWGAGFEKMKSSFAWDVGLFRSLFFIMAVEPLFLASTAIPHVLSVVRLLF